MSRDQLLRNGTIAALGFAGLTLSACASGHQSSRYTDVYAYESGGACGYSECAATTYQGVDQTYQYYEPAPEPTTGVVYADCGQIGMMDCGYGTSTATTTTHTSPSIAECPAGTYMGADGSCMSSSSTTGYYDSTTTTSTYTPSTTTTFSGPVECPAGTTLQPDNTCMQMGSSSWSGSTTTTTSTYTPSTTTTVSCPAGTVMSGDGTCMETTTTTTTHGGYTSSGGYTASDYLPIRK